MSQRTLRTNAEQQHDSNCPMHKEAMRRVRFPTVFGALSSLVRVGEKTGPSSTAKRRCEHRQLCAEREPMRRPVSRGTLSGVHTGDRIITPEQIGHAAGHLGSRSVAQVPNCLRNTQRGASPPFTRYLSPECNRYTIPD